MSTELEQLVLDTLHDRRRAATDSCLVVNEAGMELLASTAEALPVIERVLRTVVIPAMSEQKAEGLGFLGLDYVLGAYLVIGCKTGLDRTVAFLREIPHPLLIQAFSAIPIFFRRMKDGYNSGVPPAPYLVAFLHELSGSPQREVRDEARGTLEQLRSQDSSIS